MTVFLESAEHTGWRRLSIECCAHAAFVIEWHVLGMFAPSFFTGHLIRRFGVLQVILTGGLLSTLCVIVNLTGSTLPHFWAALVLLGVGWNFMFIGTTTLLTEAYVPEEKGKTQALNDFLVFTTVTLAVLSAGSLHTVSIGRPSIMVWFAYSR